MSTINNLKYTGDKLSIEKAVLKLVEGSVDATTGKKAIVVDAGIETSYAKYDLMQSDQWIRVLVDSEDKIIAGIKPNGSVYINNIIGVSEDIEEIKRALGVVGHGVSFTGIGVDKLTVSGSSTKSNGVINLAAGIENRAYFDGVLQNWHYSMLCKFRCTSGVSFVMGKDKAKYGAWIEVVKDSGTSYLKVYATMSDGQGGYIVGLKHTATLDFSLNENEDYVLIVKSDVDNTGKYWNIELIGEQNEYFAVNTSTLSLGDIQGYGNPFFYSETTATVKEYAFTINDYYDVKNVKIAAFGHSLVEADSLGVNRDKCFAALLAKQVGEDKCPNFGLGGLTMPELIKMLDGCLLLTGNIQYAIIVIGANDSSLTTEQLIANMQTIINKIEEAGITPILTTIHPVLSLGGMTLTNFTAFNTWIRNSGYLYCDFEQVFVNVDIVATGYANITNANIRTDLYLPDNTHPTVQGHQFMFNRLKMDCPFLF